MFALVTFETHDMSLKHISLVGTGEVVWHREESLAHIEQVEFVVPPVSAEGMDDQVLPAATNSQILTH